MIPGSSFLLILELFVKPFEASRAPLYKEKEQVHFRRERFFVDGRRLSGMLHEILQSGFFTESCSFTGQQLRAGDHRSCLLQSMMLLDTRYLPGFALSGFSEDSVSEYARSIREVYSDKQSNMLRSVIQYLTDAFPERNRHLKKISIPIVAYLADMAMDAGIEPLSFRQWWEFFTQEDPLFEAYRPFCGSGSGEREKIYGRLAVMAKSFAAYHGIKSP